MYKTGIKERLTEHEERRKRGERSLGFQECY